MLKKVQKEILLLGLLIILQTIILAKNSITFLKFHNNIIYLRAITEERMINPKVFLTTIGFRIMPDYSYSPTYIDIRINIDDFSRKDVLNLEIEYDSLNGRKKIIVNKFLELKDFFDEIKVEVSTIETLDGWKGVLVNNSNGRFNVENVYLDNRIKIYNSESNLYYLPESIEDGFHEIKVFYLNKYNVERIKKIKFFKKGWFYASSNLKGASYRVRFIDNYLVKKGDSIYKIARKYDVKPGEIILYNNISDPKTIYPGQLLKIGKLKFGESPLIITVDLDKSILNLYYLGKKVLTFPAAVGRSDATPPGYYRIMYKEKEPALYWYGEYIKPGSIINGVGSRWLQLSVEQYGIHGTTKPWEIGKRISHGCIRLLNQDVELLDFLTGIGTEVYALKSAR
ncbi:L,D-transpeptidase family protein [Marinitoga aeolica]|uniref:L,D-transpeptidase family protein n=1 Tax=Marinitoga aeolica TaxID=2809031 RepID=A0ABY8PQ24_9BACT|nr:L,D-transpeptidase family protein [Marinitoga aeolica]WGS64746.1 L,D-transpeptidase family protein [Marinitoga aeolica]